MAQFALQLWLAIHGALEHIIPSGTLMCFYKTKVIVSFIQVYFD